MVHSLLVVASYVRKRPVSYVADSAGAFLVFDYGRCSGWVIRIYGDPARSKGDLNDDPASQQGVRQATLRYIANKVKEQIERRFVYSTVNETC